MTVPAGARSRASPQARTRVEDLTRLVHTVRYLKIEQVAARVSKHLPRGVPASSATPPRRVAMGTWATPVERPRSLFPEGRVRFLNEDGYVRTAADWNASARPKLWLYNLHYHDDLSGAFDGAHVAAQLEFIHRWIGENPTGQGNGWEPYPVSLRLVNWIKWTLAGGPITPAMLDSLAMQTRWLARRVEWHLLGNHVLANAKALLFAGLFFSGPEADAWLRQGLAIFAREWPEQILSDGGHFELSPMYHTIILEDALDVWNVARTYGIERDPTVAMLPAMTTRMRRWLTAMTHPDGDFAFFNDGAFGIAAKPGDIEGYALRLGLSEASVLRPGWHHLAASGYVRIDHGPVVLLCDIAAVGPTYIPGHAHADTLSFELSLAGRRVIVNGGTSTYAPGADRAAQRATRAHNTVEVDAKNSSDVWAQFRVGERACVRDVAVGIAPDGAMRVTATHDGYRRQFRGPLHRRTWRIDETGLTITDELIGGRGPEVACARIHVHPDHRVTAGPDTRVAAIDLGGQRLAIDATSDLSLVGSHWHPEFGCALPRSTLEATFTSSTLSMQFRWS
jgi:uncharacterized heparinase superfamily protein